MKKLVKIGLLVPVLAILVFATGVMAESPERSELNGELNSDLNTPVNDAEVVRDDVNLDGNADEVTTASDDTGRDSTRTVAARRTRSMARTQQASSSADRSEKWWWWGSDSDDDGKDDSSKGSPDSKSGKGKDQSPSTP